LHEGVFHQAQGTKQHAAFPFLPVALFVPIKHIYLNVMTKKILPLLAACLLFATAASAQAIDSSKLNSLEKKVEKKERKAAKKQKRLERQQDKLARKQRKLNRADKKANRQERKLRREQNRIERANRDTTFYIAPRNGSIA
jgi:septal ring factor EnvC (AmiA/AmiB activator)